LRRHAQQRFRQMTKKPQSKDTSAKYTTHANQQRIHCAGNTLLREQEITGNPG
jgi:hypothetical protein